MLLDVSNLHKAYAAPVLSGVSLDLRAGEVHALVGENGAGKSTLVKIVAGMIPPDDGELRYKGLPFAPKSKAEAESAGVRLVLQELNTIGTLSVAENLVLDRLPKRFGLIRGRQLRAEARRALELVGLGELDPDTPAGALGVGQRQLVEIAAGLARRCEMLILDEPTAALTPVETGLLFAQIEKLKRQGVGIIYISHRLEELKGIADRVSVLRDGKRISTRPASEAENETLVREMIGREVDPFGTRDRSLSAPPSRKVALRVEGLRAGPAVKDVSFDARRGEILGLAGLMGAGRTETLRAIFGADRRDGGKIYLHGDMRPARIENPHDAVRLGLALIPEDRKEQGLLLAQPVRHNITLTRQGASARRGVIQRQLERRQVEELVLALRVRCESVEQPVAQLSGGNQQKVVIAKWLYRDPEILLFDEPTRGVDVGAKFEIYRLLEDLAGRGNTLIVASSELEELMTLCHRIAVMSAGHLVRVFDRGAWGRAEIMDAAFSRHVAGGDRGAGRQEE
jgi:ribose transport system ATP-binding protein